jgi:hypothetical protein
VRLATALVLALALGACDAGAIVEGTGGVSHGAPDAGHALADARGADARPAPDAPGWQADGQAFPLQLAHSAFPPPGPTLPNMIVYLPRGFDASQPLDVVVYLHGWNNCISNAIQAVNGSCVPGGAIHNGYGLAGQLDASGKNAILLLPEVAFDQPSSAIGALASAGSFLAIVDETLGRIEAQVGGRTAADVERILVASHSGAYTAAAAILDHGGLAVDETWLLDSLYGDESSFDAWVKDDEDAFRAPFRHRLASIYTLGGGTLDNTQAMASRAATWFSDAGVILDDRTTATLAPADYAHGLVFKRTALAHDDVPRTYFQELLETSVLTDRR